MNIIAKNLKIEVTIIWIRSKIDLVSSPCSANRGSDTIGWVKCIIHIIGIIYICQEWIIPHQRTIKSDSNHDITSNATHDDDILCNRQGKIIANQTNPDIVHQERAMENDIIGWLICQLCE
ncbi:hypothetical protein AZL_e03430 (plasmid) [Azospirillum sp. B510]|nr:hypothetical protein AZL_e03430 [Azospirillum sp. B510]